MTSQVGEKRPALESLVDDRSTKKVKREESLEYDNKGVRDDEDEIFDQFLKACKPNNLQFIKACKNGDLQFVVSIIEKKIVMNWNEGLYFACSGGHMQIVKVLIKKGANNWNAGMFGACLKGHLRIVKLLIKKGADNWDNGFYGACYAGDLRIIELLITKGTKDWNIGMYNACRGGQMKIVEFMITKGANDWNQGLRGARSSGHLHIVKFMIEKGATNVNDLWLYEAYQLLELGTTLQTFMGNKKFEQLIASVQLFRKQLNCVVEPLLMSFDLTNIVKDYSLN